MVYDYHPYATALQFASHRSDDGYMHSFPSHFGWTTCVVQVTFVEISFCALSAAFAYCTQLDLGAVLLPGYHHIQGLWAHLAATVPCVRDCSAVLVVRFA